MSVLKDPLLLDAMVDAPPAERWSRNNFKQEMDEDLWDVTGSGRTRSQQSVKHTFTSVQV